MGDVGWLDRAKRVIGSGQYSSCPQVSILKWRLNFIDRSEEPG